MKHFESESGPVDSAIVDGYHFGDRLLEDVHFIITIDDQGKFHAKIHPDSAEYFEQFNQKKWLKEAEEYAEDNDIFLHPNYPDCHEDVWVEGDDGSNSLEGYQPPGVPVKVLSFGDVLNKAGLSQYGKIK